MFLQKLRALCEECDWLASTFESAALADTGRLHACVDAVVASGRRSSTPGALAFANALYSMVEDGYTDDDFIDTFAGIV